MSEPTISWSALKNLMITTQPDLVVHGTVSTDERELYVGMAWSEHTAPQLTPVVLADEDGPATLRVVISGEYLRLDHPDGTPYFILGDRAWLFEEDPACPYEDQVSQVQWVGTITDLVSRPSHDRFEGTDFTTPTGPVHPAEYLGRPAWEVELAPPSHKPYPLTYVVDAETGLLLQKRNERAGLLAGWTEFRVGGSVPADTFTWTGPVVTEEERAAAHWAEHQADMRRREEWFERNVAPQPVTLQLTHTGTIDVHYWEDDGSFDGSLGEPVVSFSRRPLTRPDFDTVDDDTVDDDTSSDTTYEWTSGEWRWQVTTYDATLTPDALTALQEQLHALPTG
ncbi:hypothetical protein [Flexivirga oryzae]|uniref:Uncharacterized protein n=1 Tax=Flexivirga oryzae TaxID=1794944 RepID=A0A839N5Z6_9MICO|nr:hypothetical protein [Flexivirga oryzae]MBB2891473.1 hypothetical protein [Flexivirga oryzae]